MYEGDHLIWFLFSVFGGNMKDSKQAFILQQNGVKSLV